MPVLLDAYTRELLEQGFTLITDIYSDEEAIRALSVFGELVPQYDGSLRYEVKAAPGFENRTVGLRGLPRHRHKQAPAPALRAVRPETLLGPVVKQPSTIGGGVRCRQPGKAGHRQPRRRRTLPVGPAIGSSYLRPW
jgi:hypothetical protein